MPSGSVGSGSAIQCGGVRVSALGQRWVWLATLRLNLLSRLYSLSWGHSRFSRSLDALAIWQLLDTLEALATWSQLGCVVHGIHLDGMFFALSPVHLVIFAKLASIAVVPESYNRAQPGAAASCCGAFVLRTCVGPALACPSQRSQAVALAKRA